MYVSPLSERIRKRKAFADSELDSSAGLMAIPPMPSPTLSAIANASSFPSHTQTMYAMQTYARENRYQFHKVNQHNDECDTNRFVRQHANHLPSHSNSDETNFFESNSTSPPSSTNTFSDQIKPKLSFSIESIIGIK